MKVKGKTVTKGGPIPIVLPRIPKEDSIIFHMVPLEDNDEFNRQFPDPKPPVIKLKGGQEQLNVNSPVYKQQVADRSKLFTAWTIIKSLRVNQPDSDVELETVDLEDANTWPNWEKEMKDSGITGGEILYIINEMNRINGANIGQYDEARDSFLNGDLLEKQPTSQQVEASAT